MPQLRHPRPGAHAARGLARRRLGTRPAKEGPLSAGGARPEKRPRTLVLGIGNPGRRDDGLGPALVERLRRRRLRGVRCDANYQLNVEDGLACAEHDRVVFVDAARGLRKPFAFRPLEPAGALPAMSHALGPAAVLAVAAALYGKRPEARVLAVRGHRFTVGEGLTDQAERNLELALAFLAEYLKGARS